MFVSYDWYPAIFVGLYNAIIAVYYFMISDIDTFRVVQGAVMLTVIYIFIVY